jgi:hypothetical protein
VKRIYYTVKGETQALRPYRYQTEDGQRWTFYGKDRAEADAYAIRWARKRGQRIYKVKRRKRASR